MIFNPALAGKAGTVVDFAAEDGTYGDATLVDCNGVGIKLRGIGNVVTFYAWSNLKYVNPVPPKKTTRRKKK